MRSSSSDSIPTFHSLTPPLKLPSFPFAASLRFAVMDQTEGCRGQLFESSKLMLLSSLFLFGPRNLCVVAGRKTPDSIANKPYGSAVLSGAPRAAKSMSNDPVDAFARYSVHSQSETCETFGQDKSVLQKGQFFEIEFSNEVRYYLARFLSNKNFKQSGALNVSKELKFAREASIGPFSASYTELD